MLSETFDFCEEPVEVTIVLILVVMEYALGGYRKH